MPVTYLRYTGDLPEIWLRYTWDIPEIYLKYTWDIHQIFMRFLRYTQDIHEIYLTLCILSHLILVGKKKVKGLWVRVSQWVSQIIGYRAVASQLKNTHVPLLCPNITLYVCTDWFLPPPPFLQLIENSIYLFVQARMCRG